MGYAEVVGILASYGIPLANGGIARTQEEATSIATKIGYPVAIKAISGEVSHKTEADAVRLDLKDDSELARAYDEVINNLVRYNPKAEIAGVLVQEMVKSGTEVIIGVSRDPSFGPVLLFGLGGIFVELLKDVSLRLPPITRQDAEEMVREIKSYKILDGFRGKPKADVEAIVDILLKVSRLSVDLKDSIAEMDLNPVIVQSEGNGAKVVDARFITYVPVGTGPSEGGRR